MFITCESNWLELLLTACKLQSYYIFFTALIYVVGLWHRNQPVWEARLHQHLYIKKLIHNCINPLQARFSPTLIRDGSGGQQEVYDILSDCLKKINYSVSSRTYSNVQYRSLYTLANSAGTLRHDQAVRTLIHTSHWHQHNRDKASVRCASATMRRLIKEFLWLTKPASARFGPSHIHDARLWLILEVQVSHRLRTNAADSLTGPTCPRLRLRFTNRCGMVYLLEPC